MPLEGVLDNREHTWELSISRGCLSELRAIIEELNHPQSLSHQVTDVFGYTLEKVIDLRFKFSKIKLLLNAFAHELTNHETKLTVLRGPSAQYCTGHRTTQSSEGRNCRESGVDGTLEAKMGQVQIAKMGLWDWNLDNSPNCLHTSWRNQAKHCSWGISISGAFTS